MLKLKKEIFYRVFIEQKHRVELEINAKTNVLSIIYKNRVLKLTMPSHYFFRLGKNEFIFTKKGKFKKVLTHLVGCLVNYHKYYYVKLKLKGLGYKIEKITKNFYKFFFAYNHYFYFHVPQDILIKSRKRTLIMFSNNLAKLNDIYTQLLKLKKLDLYERNNSFIAVRKIKFFKKRK